ncbi:MAG: hypothetical protein WCO65_01485 [bacterium]
MDILTDIFEIFKFDDAQKKKAFADLDTLIKAKITNDLVSQLPVNTIQEIQLFENFNSNETQEKIAIILQQHFSSEKIKDMQQAAIGYVVMEYLAYMYGEQTAEQQVQITNVLKKYGVHT